MDELLARSHDGLDVFGMDGTDVPLILLEEERFLRVMAQHPSSMSVGDDSGPPRHGMSVKTDLNILRDGMGHVFVEVVMSFGGGVEERVMINANNHLDFFKRLAETTMLALAPARPDDPRVFMIQLPRAQSAEDALRMIEDGLASGDGR